MKSYTGQELNGTWVITIKLDGVQVIVKDGVALSRAGKPLYGIPKLKDGVYEAFKKDWSTTVSLLRSKDTKTLAKKYFYRLSPTIDSRLVANKVKDADQIKAWFKATTDCGYEGLVLHGPNGETLKVKPTETHDLTVLKVIPGKGKHTGKMGALLTSMGKVGTGFTDAERESEWSIGEVIEVEAMGTNASGKLRHPRFIRRRFDK